MGQYRTGTVDVINGSLTVIGHGTAFLANVSIADFFKVSGINTIYVVATVDTDTEITLTSTWAGSTLTNQEYQIATDWTTNYNFGEIWAGDKDWPYWLTNSLRQIDQRLKDLSDRIETKATTTTTSTSSTSSTASTTSTTSSTMSTTSSTMSTTTSSSSTTTTAP